MISIVQYEQAYRFFVTNEIYAMSSAKLFLFFFMITFANSCDKMEEELPVEISAEFIPEEPNSYTYLALGDSYTIGQGVAEDQRYPIQLQRRLLEDSIVIDTVKILAQTGWTTQNLLNAIEQDNPEQHDFVSLLIGVNNQYQGIPFSVFEEDLNKLLDKAELLSTNESEGVFVISIPDYGVTPFGALNAEQISEELDNYNLYTKQICEARSIPYIDITELSRLLGADNGALASDNLHPSGYQYSKWVTEMLPVVVQLID